MKTYCVIAIDEEGMAHIIKKSAPVLIQSVNLQDKLAGIYEAYIDDVGICIIEKQLMISTRGC